MVIKLSVKAWWLRRTAEPVLEGSRTISGATGTAWWVMVRTVGHPFGLTQLFPNTSTILTFI